MDKLVSFAVGIERERDALVDSHFGLTRIGSRFA